MKLPPIYTKPGSQSNDHISSNGGDRYLKWNGKYKPDSLAQYNSQDENEDDIWGFEVSHIFKVKFLFAFIFELTFLDKLKIANNPPIFQYNEKME